MNGSVVGMESVKRLPAVVSGGTILVGSSKAGENK